MTAPTASRLHRPYFRNGEDHRAGSDVSFADVVKVFGFKGVTIGKWVSKEEQQLAANLFFDALCDLQDILQVPAKVISLDGNLSLAFGSGGNKYSSAHYDTRRRTLALAKNAGGGALAHEWFHAFDHYICQKLYPDASAKDFASASWLDNQALNTHPLNIRLCNWFEALFLQDGGEPSQLVLQSAKVDKALQAYYYAQPQELAARAFEACIQAASIKNAFLVQGTKQSQEAKMGIYPDTEHLQQLTPLLADYFQVLGQALSPRHN